MIARSWLLRILLATVFVVARATSVFAAQPTTPPAHAPDVNDKSTPRRTVENFLRAARANDFDKAAQFLDLRSLSAVKRTVEGPTLAHDLLRVLDRKLWLDPGKISDDPDGDPSDGPGSDLLGTVELDDEPVSIAVSRTKNDAGKETWLFSKTTVAMVPALYAVYGEHWLGDKMPPSLAKPRFLGVAAWQWIGIALAIFVGYWAGQLLGALASSLLDRFAARTHASWDDAVAASSRGPARLVIAVVAGRLLLEALHLPAPAQLVADRTTTTLLVVTLAAFVIRAIHLAADAFTARLPGDTAGELRSRGVKTQLLVARRIASIVIGLLACAAILIQFEFVRAGMSLLASAGIVGVVFGFAAQKSLSGIIAGIQLSITQPIRIGDLVVIENETGVVEEINLTFVVVRIWDDRRLIVPIGRFLETPFQNHSKLGTAQLGTVLLKVDPTTPIAALRAELERVVRANAKWDTRVAKLRVIDADDKTITVRALVSAANPDDLWDLRCDVREGLISFVQSLEGGRYLARIRVQPLEGPSEVQKLFTEPKMEPETET